MTLYVLGFRCASGVKPSMMYPFEGNKTIVVTAANDAHDRKWEGTELGCLDAGQHMSGTHDQG